MSLSDVQNFAHFAIKLTLKIVFQITFVRSAVFKAFGLWERSYFVWGQNVFVKVPQVARED